MDQARESNGVSPGIFISCGKGGLQNNTVWVYPKPRDMSTGIVWNEPFHLPFEVFTQHLPLREKKDQSADTFPPSEKGRCC